MEKIYMEEQNQNQKRKKRSLMSSTSIMMSFILAFVAIISIVAYGFGKVSFAIPDEGTTEFPDTIVTGDESDDGYKIKGPNTNTIQIALHRTNSGKYIYCIESEVDIAESTTYKKENEVTDKGLLFLLNYLLSEDFQIVDASGNKVPEKVKGWIAQSAIWVYQTEVGAKNSVGTNMTVEKANLLRNEKVLFTMADITTNIFESTQPIYTTCKLTGTTLAAKDTTIAGLIDKAKRIHNGTEAWNAFTLTVNKKSDTISLTSDEKYYQSDVITINGTEGFLGFKIDLSKAPKGTMILNTKGEELKDEKLDNLTNGTQVVVRVPVSAITEENKNVAIEVTGAFKGDMAYRYTAPNRQTVAFTGKITKHVKSGVNLEFNYTPDVPDTSITAAQSVYFIGLIILLAGVGIIYANIKPRSANQ